MVRISTFSAFRPPEHHIVDESALEAAIIAAREDQFGIVLTEVDESEPTEWRGGIDDPHGIRGRCRQMQNDNHPLEIAPFDGGVTIYGADIEDYIIVGKTSAPDPSTPNGDITEHNCIVSMKDGNIERSDPNAVALLHELAELLGYTLHRQKRRL